MKKDRIIYTIRTEVIVLNKELCGREKTRNEKEI